MDDCWRRLRYCAEEQKHVWIKIDLSMKFDIIVKLRQGCVREKEKAAATTSKELGMKQEFSYFQPFISIILYSYGYFSPIQTQLHGTRIMCTVLH